MPENVTDERACKVSHDIPCIRGAAMGECRAQTLGDESPDDAVQRELRAVWHAIMAAQSHAPLKPQHGWQCGRD